MSQRLWVLQIKCGCDLRGLHVRTWSQVKLHSWILDQDDTWTLFYIRLIDHMDELKSRCSRYDYLTCLLRILSQRVFAHRILGSRSPTNPHMNPAVWVVHLSSLYAFSKEHRHMSSLHECQYIEIQYISISIILIGNWESMCTEPWSYIKRCYWFTLFFHL